MTKHDPALCRLDKASPSNAAASDSVIRPLATLAVLTVGAAGALFVLSHPNGLAWIPTLRVPGVGFITGSLLLAGFGLVACLVMVRARRRAIRNQESTGRISTRRHAGWAHTVLAILFITPAAYAVLVDWPLHSANAEALTSTAGFTVASVLLLLATPWLLAGRYVAVVSAERLPEKDDLQALLFLPVFCLGAQAVLLVAAALGFGALYWVRVSLFAILLLICAELSLRTLATWFLPPPDILDARATINSLLAGMVRGRALSPAIMARTVRSQFGIDFSRSWALHFVRAAAAPVALLMLAFCWFLTGVTRIDLNERGAYERFGLVTEILKPGLHLVMPWPFGMVRHVELGVMHAALVQYGDQAINADAVDRSTAEGDAPASASRLWDSEQPTDVSYIIASSEQNRQSFQTVSASVRVLYRIGLDDDNARAALYHEEDPDALVRVLTGRLLAQFFAKRTLPSVLGENQGVIAEDVRAQLRQALDQLASGIDIVAVTIEAIHPPAGAASAYRNVQAAEIAAITSIATERGRAQTTQSVALRDAHGATGAASASAAETVSAAQVDLTGIMADDRPYRAASEPFLLERYFTDIKTALENVPLQIIDHRLSGVSMPTIDLRPPGIVPDAFDRRPSPTGTKAEKTP